MPRRDFPEFAEGDIVNITITGVRVDWVDPTTSRAIFLLPDGAGFGSVVGGFSVESAWQDLTIENTGRHISDECWQGLCGNCWDDNCGCPACSHPGA